MGSTQQFLGFNPVSSSTAFSSNEATIQVSQPSNIVRLSTQTCTSGVLQFPATGPVNWWQPPTDYSGDDDVPMEDRDNCEVDDDAMSVDSFEDDGNWDPTEITPPEVPMDLDPDPSTAANTNDQNPVMMDIDTPSDQPGFWDFMNGDYKMVVDGRSNSHAQPSCGGLNQTTPSPMFSSPYTHDHPLLRDLDANEEVDEEGDFLMKPAWSELH